MPGVDIQNNMIVKYLESLGYNSYSTNGRVVFKQYAGTDEELNSLYAGVGLRDLSHYGIVELRGVDVLDFLHRITTNSLKDLPKESISFTIFTNEKGKIIDKSAILNFGDYQLLVAAPGNKIKVISWINKYVISDDVKAADNNGRYFLFELLGPQSDSFSTLLCGDMACKLNDNTFKVVNTEGMLFFIMKVKEAAGPSRYWILTDPENGLKLVTYMVENKGPFNFNLIGEDAYNAYRIENGIPESPGELNDTINPHEARLLDLVSFTKGCYIGQEVIARLDAYDKVQKYLYGIKFNNGDTPAEVSYKLTDAGNNEAGRITSTAYSQKMKSYIGLAFIRRAYSEPGRELLAVDEAGNKFEVTAAELPFKK